MERITLSERWMTREQVRTPGEAVGYCASGKDKSYRIHIQRVQRESYGDAEGSTVFGYRVVAYGTRVGLDESATINAKWRIRHAVLAAERSLQAARIFHAEGSGSSEQVARCADDLAFARERAANPASVELEKQLILAAR